MTEHLPECEAYRDECGGGCICHHVRACEERVYQEQIAGRQNDMVLSCLRGLDAVREAVELIPAPYKVVGNFETYGPYHEGRSDMKDMALSAIDALRENQ